MSAIVRVVWIGLAAGVPWAGAAASAAERVFDVTDHGADASGKVLCTGAIQKAIDACAAGGRGTVRFPKGTYRSGAVRLRSGVKLLLDEGAAIRGSRDLKDYYLPPVEDPKGKVSFCHLISGEGLRDVAIRGAGTIDGSGSAFRDKSKPRAKCIYLVNCRNVLVEGVRLHSAGGWMQHYRLCRGLTIRNIDVFNHVAFNNDGLNVDSCRDVTITGCRVDSDDDGIVLKSLSNTPCRNVKITDCTVSSHCNALKMGTESGGGFVDISISKCKVFSPRRSWRIYGRQRGLAGIALEIVDGGRMENVSVSDVDIEGVSVAIFLRLGNRARPYVKGAKPGVGTLRKVRLSNITARKTSQIGCSITGLPGHWIEDVVLENVRLGFDGGGERKDADRKVAEKGKSYPESTMFGTLPAFGFYCRHVRGLTFRKLALTTDKADLRHAMIFEDAEGVVIDGLHAPLAAGAAPMLRMKDVRKVALRGRLPKTPPDRLMQVEGKPAGQVTVEAVGLHEAGAAPERQP